MTIGSIVSSKDRLYVIVNEQGTRERLPRATWFARLWLEILQGFGKIKSVVEVRNFISKYSVK